MTQYRLVRSSRKTLSIVVKENVVQVNAPLRLERSRIDAFVQEHASWIAKKLVLSRQNYELFSEELAYRRYLFLGKSYKPIVSAVKDFSFEDDSFLIPSKAIPKTENKEEGRRLFLKRVERIYKNLAEQYLFNRLKTISVETGLAFNTVKCINAQTKWGTCDSQNNICLNWRLCLIEKKFIDYVIIHELCHTYYPHHRQEFWNFVEKFDSKFRIHKKELKRYGILLQRLFRYKYES